MTNVSTTAEPVARRWDRRSLVALVAGRVVTAVGTGVVGPYLIIFLTRAKGFTFLEASLVASTISILAVVGGLLSGWMLDRTDWRVATVLTFVGSAVGTGGYAFADERISVYLTAGLFGLAVGAGGALWPTLIGRTFEASQRSSMFSWDFMIANGGLAIGGVLAGLILSAGGESAYRLLFLCDAGSFLVSGAVLLFVGRFSQPARAPRQEKIERSVARGAVLQANFLLFALIAVIGFVGYGQFEGIFPAFLADHTRVSETLVAVVYTVNPVAIVVGGLVLIPLLKRWSDQACFAMSVAVIGVSWTLVSVVPFLADRTAAISLAMVASVIFAIAEILMARGVPAVVNAMATDENRGRYNGVSSMAMNAGRIAGPAASGLVLSGAHPLTLFPALAATALVAAVVSWTRLRTVR